MKVKNPKTTAQTLQRVLVKVVALCYAMLKAICNHSFEGVTNGFQCMNKFKKVNLRYLRERAAKPGTEPEPVLSVHAASE